MGGLSMTREEEIRQASIAYTQSHNPVAMGGDYMQDFIDELSVNPSFIAGADWADEHQPSPWISVEDRLPEMFVDSKGITHDFSIKVLLINENNPNYWHVAEYYSSKNEWCCLEHPTYIIDNVTHWMPIPKLLK